MGLRAWLGQRVSDWLVSEKDTGPGPLCDYERLRYEIRPCDVILVEGRSRVAEVIKNITQSPWSHAVLYLGRVHDVDSEEKRARLLEHYDGSPDEQLVIEALLGHGTIVAPLSKYGNDHLRICRPNGLSRMHAQEVVAYAIDSLGSNYDVRQLVDLARFLFPYGVLPRRWRSSLFEYHAGIPTRTVCSTMLASAFMSVNYPILPVIQPSEDGTMRWYQRNPRRFTPRDFDYSPYFDIIKYPYFNLDHRSLYHRLPWSTEGLVCNDTGDCFEPRPPPVAEPDEEEPVVMEAVETDTTDSHDAPEPPAHRLNLLAHRGTRKQSQVKVS